MALFFLLFFLFRRLPHSQIVDAANTAVVAAVVQLVEAGTGAAAD